ncbi:MAG: dihydrodipicolinate synthase family protein [Clostridiales bacterium]|nr:dihydrodipicolinate synthase family protein [Clostridiales bacterium]
MYANKRRFEGIIPPIVTPLTDSRELDRDALCRLIDYDLDGGCSGIFAMGSSGEAMMTSRSVWLDTLRLTVSHVDGRAPVFAGVIDSSTARVVENIKAAEGVGASVMVVTPAFYLQNVSRDEIFRHFEAVALSTSSEIVVYNIPPTTHVNIDPGTIREIAAIDNVVAFKDSAGDWERHQRFLFMLEDRDIAVLNGAEELCAASMLFGSQGCVPGLANFFPRMFVELHEKARAGDVAGSYRLQRDISDLRKVLAVGKHWMSAMKHIAFRLGFGTGAASLPIEPLTPAEKRGIDEILERYL